jgi:hypothetical protein
MSNRFDELWAFREVQIPDFFKDAPGVGRGITPQYRLHIAFPNAQNPALPLNGRANRNKACFQQASFRLAPGLKPGAVFRANEGSCPPFSSGII